MLNRLLTRSGLLETLEQAAVIGATLVCAAWYQHALNRMNEEIQKPKILIETLATPTVLPSRVDGLTPISPVSYVAMQSEKVTPTSRATATPQPKTISVITSTPEPLTTRIPVEDAVAKLFVAATMPPEEIASRRATEEAVLGVIGAKVTLTPAVPPMAKIYTPVATPTNWPTGVATPTVDPNDPLKFDPFHARVLDSLASVKFTMLPVERDTRNHRWVFRWQSAWAPPMLDGLPPVPDGASPYTLLPRFVLRRYPLNFEPGELVIDRYPVMYMNEYKNEVQLSDMELPAGTYAFALRAEITCMYPYFKATSPWSEWQLIEIKK